DRGPGPAEAAVRAAQDAEARLDGVAGLVRGIGAADRAAGRMLGLVAALGGEAGGGLHRGTLIIYNAAMTRLAAALFLPLATAPPRPVLTEEQNAIRLFKEASGSVVFVTNIAIGQNIFLDEFAIPQGTGSGFIWDKEGHVVTNFHVVNGGSAFLV